MNQIKIPVQNKDWGFWSQSEITVYRKEDDTIVWCNHANYETETQENTIYRPDSPDVVWETNVDICDKCEAYRIDGDDYWQEAPTEGVR